MEENLASWLLFKKKKIDVTETPFLPGSSLWTLRAAAPSGRTSTLHSAAVHTTPSCHTCPTHITYLSGFSLTDPWRNGRLQGVWERPWLSVSQFSEEKGDAEKDKSVAHDHTGASGRAGT